jgi:Gram-negative bacterial TonB protein C-terminal
MNAEGCRSSIDLIGMCPRPNLSRTKRTNDHRPRSAGPGSRWIVGQGVGQGNRSAPGRVMDRFHIFRPASPSTKFDSGDAADWIHNQLALNGLQSTDLHPWHIVIMYDQFDEDGDNVHSGIVEEYWAGPKKYRISYKSDTLNQTDYATEQGLFRLGDQRWPNRTEAQVRTEVVDPFSHLATLQDFRAGNVERTFGPHSLHCVVFDKPGVISVPAQYCFEPGSSVLRYVRGEGWFQTVYNDTVPMEGRNIGRDVEVTDAGHPFLKLNVQMVEQIPEVDEKEFNPPADAVSLSGQPVIGVNPKPLQTSFPEWPSSLRQQHFLVIVEIVIGKDGRVTSAHAVSGPPDAYKAAEAAARKWRYHPYLVVGEPTEIDTKVQFQNQ